TSERVADCQSKLVESMNDTFPGLASSPEGQAAAATICKAAGQKGKLDDDGVLTQNAMAELTKANPELLVPLCIAALRAQVGDRLSEGVLSRIPGGTVYLSRRYCADLGPFINDAGLDSEALFKGRGREPYVAICVGQALDEGSRDPRNPFDEDEMGKLY